MTRAGVLGYVPSFDYLIFVYLAHPQHSSITLVGELLFKVSGISGKAETEEMQQVDVGAAETSLNALGEALGKERRDRVLSALYIVRQDAVVVVRQSAIRIWKALFHNTPRTGMSLLSRGIFCLAPIS